MNPAALSSAVLCVLAYTGMNMLFKRHAGRGGGAVQLTAWLGLLAPLWGLFLFLGAPADLLVVPSAPAYWVWCVIWALLLPGTTLLMVHLLKTLSLSELTAARKALVTLLALGVDFFVLNTRFGLPTLLAIGMITMAALNLPAPPVRRKVQRAPLPVRVGWLVLLAVLFTLQLTAYKKALVYQPDLISHIVIVKLLAALACLPLFAFIKGQSQRPAMPLILGVVACYFVGSVAEGYALQHLPLTILVVLTTATAGLMAAHDLIRKDLPRTREAFGLLALIFAGFGLLAFSH